MAVDPTKVYHGTPCKRAGHTLRWKSDHHCIECAGIARSRRRTNPAYRERERQAHREWARAKYANNPEHRERERKRLREYQREQRTNPEYREAEAEQERNRYYERRDAGVCVSCGGEDPVISEVLCGDCLLKKEDYACRL